MSLTRWNPYDMLSLRKIINRMLDESQQNPLVEWPRESLAIPVDLVELDDKFVLKADLPGLKPENIEITMVDNRLSIRGEFETEKEDTRGNVHFRERRSGAFQRTIALPTTVDTDSAAAEFEDGVLKITLAKAEASMPKKITVKAESKS
ncbi:MAG: Hsp20/alpha crystallin family protein [Anaerolineae bacterium]|nr:Hsp20/alpha crystallin family protein [Anaerolineae bacterium]